MKSPSSFAPCIAMLLCVASSAKAQRTDNNAIGISSRLSIETSAVDSVAPQKKSSRSNSTTRFFTGAVSSFGGMLAGATAGYNMEGDCSCDDPGLMGTVVGGYTGVVFGSSLGASIPNLGSSCGFSERFGRAFLGSIVGSLAGIAVTEATQTSVALLVFVPTFSAGGSILTLGHCR